VDVRERAGGQLPIEGRRAELMGADQPDPERRDQQNRSQPFPRCRMTPKWALNRNFSGFREWEGNNPPLLG
jgi:hypothetical protein